MNLRRSYPSRPHCSAEFRRCALVAALGFLAVLLFPGPVDARRDPVLPSAATAAAENLLGRLQESHRADLIVNDDLPDAFIGEGLLISGYPDLDPLYYACPIWGNSGRLLGMVAVDAGTATWNWYSLNCPDQSFPPVGLPAARSRITAHAAEFSVPAEWQSPIAVRLPDKHTYWLFQNDSQANPHHLLIQFDDPQAPILSSIDGSLQDNLDHPAQQQNRALPPDSYSPPKATERLPRPATYNIPAVPHHFQVTSWYCGCAAVQMLLDYPGEEIGQVDISDVENDISGYGTYTDDNRRACHFSGNSTAIQNPALQGYRERALGYACGEVWLYADPYNQLKDLVFLGYPVEICTCYDGGCGTGHFRVVKGYDDVLDEFIVHDPWYGFPYLGPDVHFNQAHLVNDLWDPWTSCWAMIASPWEFNPTLPIEVTPGQEFEVMVDVLYPGPGPFYGQYPVSSATATIELPPSFSLTSGTTTVSLGNPSMGDTVQVSWYVTAGGSGVTESIGFRASGLISGSSGSYTAYTDSIGGHAAVPIKVGLRTPHSAMWTDAERLTNDEGASSTSPPSSRSVFVDPEGVVHIVWADTRDGNGEVYYRQWEADTWGAEVNLSADAGFSDTPAIAGTAAGELHVVWTNTEGNFHHINYTKWDGVAWSVPGQIGNPNHVSYSPAVAADTLGNVHVVWRRIGGAGMKIFHSKWDGAVWGTETYLDGSDTRQADMPAVVTDDAGRVYVVYEKEIDNSGVSDIFCRICEDDVWASAIAVSSDSSWAHWPSVAMGPAGELHVAWCDGRNGSGDVYYRSFDGIAWGPELHIVEQDWDCQFATVAADPLGVLHFAWEDFRDGNGEIYYKYYDGTWSLDERVTSDWRSSTLPGIGADATGKPSLIWTDERDGHGELYFSRRYPPGTDVPESPGVTAAAQLIQAVWPVPSRSRVTVDFRSPAEGPILLQVFDIGGRLVRTLIHESRDGGAYRASWDGRNEWGRPVSHGVFYCRLRAAGTVEARPVIMLEP